MKQKRLALSDIAKELNISTTTISFIMNGKAEEKRISPQLTEKVLQKVNLHLKTVLQKIIFQPAGL